MSPTLRGKSQAGLREDAAAFGPYDADSLSAELVRALRGRRSCAQLSRRLGYRSNIVRRWEARECWPTAAAFLEGCAKLQPATTRLFGEFFRRTPDWLDPARPFAPASIASFLRQLRGKTPIGLLAERTQTNRYTVGRWLSGKSHPNLPEFLRFVEAASRRSLDLIALLVDPGQLKSVAAEWAQLKSAREAAYTWPWSHAVLHALEIESEGGPAGHTTAWIAERLGIDAEHVERGLSILAASGQIRRVRGRWRLDRVLSVDTSSDPVRSRELKSAWTEVGLERLRAGAAGNYGYSVFAVSRADLRRLRELHLEYIRAMQSLIASSAPVECVGLYCAQLLDLASVDNALAPAEPRGAAATSSRGSGRKRR